MANRIQKLIIALALLVASLPAAAQEQKKPPEPLTLKRGDVAPDFTLLHYDGTGTRPVRLRDFRGKKNVVAAFFVFAFTGG